MQYVSTTVAAILIATIPLFTAFFAFFLLKEKLHSNNYFGFALSFVGVVLVIIADKENMEASYKGIMLMLLAVVSAVGYGFFVKKLVCFALDDEKKKV